MGRVHVSVKMFTKMWLLRVRSGALSLILIGPFGISTAFAEELSAVQIEELSSLKDSDSLATLRDCARADSAVSAPCIAALVLRGDARFVREVLYPWDTALHRMACGT